MTIYLIKKRTCIHTIVFFHIFPVPPYTMENAPFKSKHLLGSTRKTALLSAHKSNHGKTFDAKRTTLDSKKTASNIQKTASKNQKSIVRVQKSEAKNDGRTRLSSFCQADDTMVHRQECLSCSH